MAKAVTLWLCVVASMVGLGHSQVDVHEKKDYISVSTEHLEDNSLYTSISKLAQFFMEEVEYVKDLRAVAEKKLLSADSIGHLGTYIASFEDVVGNQDEDETFVQNPINAYTLIRHVAVGWNIVENVIKDEKKRLKEGQKFPKRVRKVMARRSKRNNIPGEKDLDGVSLGIVRLHDTYKFNVTSFVTHGTFETDDVVAETGAEGLTVWDAFKIGVKGANVLLLGSGIDIMQGAMEKAKLEGVSTPPFVEALDMKTLKNLIKTAKTVHDQKLDRWGPRTELHSTHKVPFDRRLAKKKKFQPAKVNEVAKPILGKFEISSKMLKEQALRLCNGEDLRPLSVRKSLQCKYVHRNVPYYRYGPRKVEVVSLTPYIAVMHDFIMESEMKNMLETASPKLRRSLTGAGSGNGTKASETRVSNTAWLTETISSGAHKLTQRIDGFLDLEATSMLHAENYQIVNYGIGGQYDTHFDQVMMGKSKEADIQRRYVFNREMGDRMTTIMGYLSDVVAGGYTVFPKIGAFVRPTRGSMVVWWNMDTAGGYDPLTEHAGCPVMLGSKWITNKWIRINSQMFKRPCPKYTNRQLREFRSRSIHSRGELIQDP